MITRYIFGTLFVLIGAGYMLEQFDVLNFHFHLSNWWPLIFVIFGIVSLSKNKKSYIPGVILIAIGAILTAGNLGYATDNFWELFLPLILVLVGLSLLGASFKKHKKFILTEGNFNLEIMFTEFKQAFKSEQFRSSSISTVFASSELDLRNITLASNKETLELSCIFGSTTIIVPDNIHIEPSGVPFIGSFKNMTSKYMDTNLVKPTLYVKYFVTFGEIVITNFKNK